MIGGGPEKDGFVDISDNRERVLARKQGPKYIFSFGDSYTSTCFDINGPQPSACNPMGNNNLGNGLTSAQGPVWIQFLTTKYNTSPVQTYNFAVGGASIPDNYTYQVEHLYQPKYSTNRFWKGSDTLFTSWVGINDVSDAWIRKDSDELLARLDKYSALLEQMWSTGVRNFFIVNNPPLERSPFIAGFDKESVALYKKDIQIYNENLSKHVSAFQDRHPDGSIALYDVHALFTKVIDDPKKYGFTDSTSMDSDGSLWSGNFHILTGFDDFIAKDMAKTIAEFNFA
ncbi:cellulose-binding GDSL lipase/acylhydrolase [Diplocarpon mali]|nr:cellulose-binding GDSL lipase/acylhydrolase [Diplocarpon mali]